MSYTIKIPCKKDQLKDIREFVNTTLLSLSVPELEINMITLAVDEICANRIIHSNKCNESKFIQLEIKNEPNGLVFEISDKGEFFDPSAHKSASLSQLISEKKKGGIGLMLVKRIMDSIEIKQEKDFTICRMHKKLPAQFA